MRWCWNTKRRFARRGVGTSAAEVTDSSRHGFWVLPDEREHLLPFEDLPCFAGAPVRAILNDERPEPHHLYWPDPDLDLVVESIERPELVGPLCEPLLRRLLDREPR